MSANLPAEPTSREPSKESLERARAFRKQLWSRQSCGHGRSFCDDCFAEWLAAEFAAVRQQGIEAGIEAAAELFVDGRNGHWHLGEISKLIRALDPAAIAAKVAERPTAEGRKPR